MSGPTETAGYGVVENEPPEFSSRQNGADPCSSRSVIDQRAPRDCMTTARNSLSGPPSLFPRGNAMMNDSVSHRAAPHNDARAGPNPRMIIPESLRSRSHPLPTRLIPSHVPSDEFGMAILGNNLMDRIDQIGSLHGPQIRQGSVSFGNNISAAFLSNNHGRPTPNAIRIHRPNGPPTTGSLYRQNQSAEGVMAHSIQSNGLSRPQARLRAPIQVLGGNPAARIPSNSQDRRMMHGNNGRMSPAELNMLRRLHREHIRARAMAGGAVRAGLNPSNILQTPQACTQDRMLGPSDRILRPGCNRDANLDPHGAFQRQVSEDPDELELIEPDQGFPHNIWDPDDSLLMPCNPGHTATSSSFELSDTEQTKQAGHSEMAWPHDAICDLLNELPPIQRHQGYLQNVMGPDDELFRPAVSRESSSIQAASIGNGNAEQAGQSITNWVPGISSYSCNESTPTQPLQGNRFNCGPPDDQPISSNSCHRPEIAVSSRGVMELKRNPVESCLEPTVKGVAGSVVAHDQSGKPNSVEVDPTVQPAKDLQIQANNSRLAKAPAENPSSANENGAAPKIRKRKPRQLTAARTPPIPRKAKPSSANKGQCAQSGKPLLEPSQTAPPQRCVDGPTSFSNHDHGLQNWGDNDIQPPLIMAKENCQMCGGDLSSTSMGGSEPVRYLPCNHAFHKQCLVLMTTAEWAGDHPPCVKCANGKPERDHGP